MSLKCGILGLPNVGKSTLFNSISTGKAEAENFPFCTIEPNLGVVSVPDVRIEKLSELVKPQKIIPTTINFVDIAGLVKGASKGEGLGNKFLSNLKEVDLLIHVIRCFKDDNIVHVNGKIDPVSDKEVIDYELIIKDLDSVDRRIDKIKKQAYTGDKEKEIEYKILKTCKSHLENGLSLRNLDLEPNQVKWIKHLSLITLKPLVYVANIDEQTIKMDNKHISALKSIVNDEKLILIKICASLEEQLYELKEEEKALFLDDYGISESGLDILIKASYKSLDLITYFTAGEKEVRAWTVKKDSTAPKAAGIIHTDFEKGFIKAEVISYNDFISYKSEIKCKEAGKLSVEGKDYIVKDGDIIHFRFNV
tara:strand:+ start:1389 stop:2483 length:1095 start_codon:yes stop_codon:yes gene_type:complete